MARMPRLVVPGYPHHVTQRGARRMQTFFRESDFRFYLDLIAEKKDDAGVEVWAYCLMPNHVHLVVVPQAEDSLANLFRWVHRRYSRFINLRNQWQGHLWQERFHSAVMDETYLIAAVRYVELNPVRAKLCGLPELWPWSSAQAHLSQQDNQVVTVAPMLSRIDNWSEYLSTPANPDELKKLRKHSSSGRPIGDEAFIQKINSGDSLLSPSTKQPLNLK